MQPINRTCQRGRDKNRRRVVWCTPLQRRVVDAQGLTTSVGSRGSAGGHTQFRTTRLCSPKSLTNSRLDPVSSSRGAGQGETFAFSGNSRRCSRPDPADSAGPVICTQVYDRNFSPPHGAEPDAEASRRCRDFEAQRPKRRWRQASLTPLQARIGPLIQHSPDYLPCLLFQIRAFEGSQTTTMVETSLIGRSSSEEAVSPFRELRLFIMRASERFLSWSSAWMSALCIAETINEGAPGARSS